MILKGERWGIGCVGEESEGDFGDVVKVKKGEGGMKKRSGGEEKVKDMIGEWVGRVLREEVKMRDEEIKDDMGFDE